MARDKSAESSLKTSNKCINNFVLIFLRFYTKVRVNTLPPANGYNAEYNKSYDQR